MASENIQHYIQYRQLQLGGFTRSTSLLVFSQVEDAGPPRCTPRAASGAADGDRQARSSDALVASGAGCDQEQPITATNEHVTFSQLISTLLLSSRRNKGELPNKFISRHCTRCALLSAAREGLSPLPHPSVQTPPPNPSLAPPNPPAVFPQLGWTHQTRPRCRGLRQSTRARRPPRPARRLALLASKPGCLRELPPVIKLEGHQHLARLPPTPKINNSC